MNKFKTFFNIFSLVLIVVDLAFFIYFIPALVGVLSKTLLFSIMHLILLLVTLVINILYLGFITFILVRNNLINKQKIKNYKD